MNKKFLASSLLAFSIHSSADSLLDIYNDALENDPQYKSAEFSYLSGKEIKALISLPDKYENSADSVSYTHLTLPTIYSV